MSTTTIRLDARSGFQTHSRGREFMRRLGGSALQLAFVAALVAALHTGWTYRAERHLTPEHGIGYWLGVAGVGAMLLLLVYPARKRFRTLAPLGSVPFWFRVHMAMGLLAPALILLHCNFQSQSRNATVALISMLVVAASGLIGRYLYRRLHRNLSGQRRTAASVFEESAGSSESHSGTGMRISPTDVERLHALTRDAIAPSRSLWGAAMRSARIRRQCRRLRREIVGRMRSDGVQGGSGRLQRQHRKQISDTDHAIGQHFLGLQRAASLGVSERLFALWHYLHMPLFAVMCFAIVVHVLAVHWY